MLQMNRKNKESTYTVNVSLVLSYHWLRMTFYTLHLDRFIRFLLGCPLWVVLITILMRYPTKKGRRHLGTPEWANSFINSKLYIFLLSFIDLMFLRFCFSLKIDSWLILVENVIWIYWVTQIEGTHLDVFYLKKRQF